MNNGFSIPTAAHLKNVIHSFWHVDRSLPNHKEHIIPNGIIEIIFNFSDGDPINVNLNNQQYSLPRIFINGFNTSPLCLELPSHQVFFGVRLQPLAVKKIVGTPPLEFSDKIFDLSLADKGFGSLWHQLAEQTCFETRVTFFCDWVERRLFNLHGQEEQLNEFLSAIHLHDISVKDLASTLCYSPRHLSRKIFEVTRMNTEEILLYKKYLHAVHLIHYSDLTLTQIAYQSNFADQSHFIKSFRSFTQITPGEYSRNKGQLKGHILENVR